MVGKTDYIDSIKRPFTNWNTLCVGVIFYFVPSLLSIVSLWLFPSLWLSLNNGEPAGVVFAIVLLIVTIASISVVSGYEIECAHKPKGKLPKWMHLKNLSKRGLQAIFIVVTYVIFLILILGILAIIGGFPKMPAMYAVNSNVILLVLAVIAFLATIYVMPAALVFFSKKYDVKQAFNCSHIWKNVATFKYFKAFLLAAAYFISFDLIVSLVSYVLSGVSFLLIIPVVVEFFLLFVVNITIMSLFGQVLKSK